MKQLLFAICSVALVGSAVSTHAGETELVKAVLLEKVNGPADEDDPFPAAAGLYFASNRAGRWEIFVSTRSSAAQPFGPGKVFLSSPEADYRSPFGMGNTLYFAHNKVPDEKLKDLKNFDLVKKTGTLAPLPLIDISDRTDELYPWITSSGKEFYFSRKLEAGWTQFVALGPSPGPIGKAQEVGFPPGVHHATLTAGGLTMYLQGPLENDRIGIFRSKRAKLGAAWSKPEPVSALNHPDGKRGDMSPALSSDGARLYFVSDRPGGKGGLDIWSTTVKDLK
ncbi:MAG: hypothetical protein L0Y72_25915 [Gemmataceae bacterium]|nr:hypothetical protein [Gemmataceae bacterium]MCI0742484.1 hypothetical protein [Gemmataceae bacterium]